jgi:cell division protein FtsB
MTSAVKKRKPIELPIAQFVAIIVLTLSVFLIIDFGRRAATGYRYNREKVRLQAQLNRAQQTQLQLLAQLDYIKTDAYVEQVARNELKWSRPGETVVVVLPKLEALPQREASRHYKTNADGSESAFSGWVNLFFPDSSEQSP